MSEKRLFVLTITHEAIVVAESAKIAENYAEHYEMRGESNDPTYRAAPMSALPADWELSSTPYGQVDPADPHRTVGAWIALGAAPEYSALKATLSGAARHADPSFDALLARSSLGTPEAVAIRQQASPKTVARILARADELQVARDLIREVDEEARAAASVDEAVDLLVAELVVEVARRLAAEKKVGSP